MDNIQLPDSHNSVSHLCRMMIPRADKVKLLALFITAKLDESGTHGADYTVMAGYIAKESQWAELEARWVSLLAEFNIEEFHSVKLSNKYYWPEFSRRARILFNQSSLFSIQAAVLDADYKWFKESVREKVRRYRPDSIYAMCFRQCMIQACRWVGNKYPGEQVSFVLEGGHKNWQDAGRVFNVTKYGRVSASSKSDLAPFLHAMAFAPKIVPAMGMADFCVYGAYQDLAAGKFEGTKKLPKRKLPKLIRVLCKRQYFENKLIPAILAEKEKQKVYAQNLRAKNAKSSSLKKIV